MAAAVRIGGGCWENGGWSRGLGVAAVWQSEWATGLARGNAAGVSRYEAGCMGTHRGFYCAALTIGGAFIIAMLAGGCQMGSVPQERLVEQRLRIDDTGLSEAMTVEEVKAVASLPLGWVELKTQKTLLYTHQQWRSPTKRTAVGVTYVRLPLPLGRSVVEWMVMGEITKRAKCGKLIRDWQDDVGRHWFEVEDQDFHLVGYLMVRGFDVWLNYRGYRLREPKDQEEIQLADRALGTVLPMSAQVEGSVAAK